eukprot:1788503-Amphidinium_carterae.1
MHRHEACTETPSQRVAKPLCWQTREKPQSHTPISCDMSSVPIFFMISQFLIFGGKQKEAKREQNKAVQNVSTHPPVLGWYTFVRVSLPEPVKLRPRSAGASLSSQLSLHYRSNVSQVLLRWSFKYHRYSRTGLYLSLRNKDARACEQRWHTHNLATLVSSKVANWIRLIRPKAYFCEGSQHCISRWTSDAMRTLAKKGSKVLRFSWCLVELREPLPRVLGVQGVGYITTPIRLSHLKGLSLSVNFVHPHNIFPHGKKEIFEVHPSPQRTEAANSLPQELTKSHLMGVGC